MTLAYLNRRTVTIPADAHVVVAVVRNEALRLPYFISYYRQKGFDAFIFVDNDSTDGTRELLMTQPDIFVFGTTEDYSASGYGLTWTNFILERFCVGHWVLVADADEILVWPSSEQETIAHLTRRLDAGGSEALFTILLDMYSNKPFGEIGYVPGAPFIEFSRFFEGGYGFSIADSFPYRMVYGGVRARAVRMQQQEGFYPPTVSKVPLVKWRRGQRFILSTHALLAPIPLAPMRGALLHFKMFDDLVAKCRIETERGQHFDGGREYQMLGATIDRLPGRSFYDPKISVPYRDTAGLLTLKVLDAHRPF